MDSAPPPDDRTPQGRAHETPSPPRGGPAGVAARAGIDSLSVFIFAVMLLGGGVLLSLALVNVKGDAALPQQGNVGWWLALGAGLLLMLEVLLRLTIPRFRAEPGLRLIVSIVLMAVGIGGLSKINFVVPVVLAGVGLVLLIAELSAPHPRAAAATAGAYPLVDGLSRITFALVLMVFGVLILTAEINSAEERAFIRYDNLDVLLPLALELLILMEIAVRAAMRRYRFGISARVALFFFVAAVGVGIKISLGWFPAILLLGAGVVLLVWLFFRV